MQSKADWVKLVLPEKFAPSEDDTLQTELRKNQDAPVQISARRLLRPDTLLLQYLVAAANYWRDRGLGFELVDMSHELQHDVENLGFTSDMFVSGAAQ